VARRFEHCILDDAPAPGREHDEDDEDQERYPPTRPLIPSTWRSTASAARSAATLRRFAIRCRSTELATELEASAELIEVLVRPRIATAAASICPAVRSAHGRAPCSVPGRSRGRHDLARNQITSSWTGQLVAALPNVNIGEQGQRARPSSATSRRWSEAAGLRQRMMLA
jgi:hypothetical protein